MNAKIYDVIVIGSGSGLIISSTAASLGLKVAVIEKGEFGGTCLNKGCIPSKVLIHTADIVEQIKDSKRFGINAKVSSINWNSIQKRVWTEIDSSSNKIEKSNKLSKNITVYKETAKFIDDHTISAGKNILKGKKIFVCAGTRPFIPNTKGLDKVNYYTSDNVMRLKKQPKSLIVLGGGYIAAELSHFFSSLGTKVTLINRSEKLLKNEDFEISDKFTELASKKFEVLLNTDVQEIKKSGKKVTLLVFDGKNKKNITADILLVAAGRIPNTDILNLKNTKIAINENGYIKVNKYLETSVPGVWAIGDIAGIYLFKHSANLEANYVSSNAFSKNKLPVDYSAMPHAVFTSPQIAGVGLTEQEAKSKKISYSVGKYYYKKTGMGLALQENEGFVKVIVGKKTGDILGCHIIGYAASTLIHEAILAMKYKLKAKDIANLVHIHPALSEVLQRAFSNLQE